MKQGDIVTQTHPEKEKEQKKVLGTVGDAVFLSMPDDFEVAGVCYYTINELEREGWRVEEKTTVAEYLGRNLPPEIYEQAAENLRRFPRKDNHGRKYTLLSEEVPLLNLFNIALSPEGHDYWIAINEMINHNAENKK